MSGDILTVKTVKRVRSVRGSALVHINRYNPNGDGSIRVTPISCGHEAPKWHGKTRLFIYLHPSYSSIHSY